MVYGATSLSGYLELLFPSTPMYSTEYITVLSCSLLLFLRENNEKNIFYFPTEQCQNSWQPTECRMIS